MNDATNAAHRHGSRATLPPKGATDMLERMAIAVLLCIVGVLFISLKAALRRAREAEKHARSWKLAAEHWEKEARS
jgi:hypothetical protein